MLYQAWYQWTCSPFLELHPSQLPTMNYSLQKRYMIDQCESTLKSCASAGKRTCHWYSKFDSSTVKRNYRLSMHPWSQLNLRFFFFFGWIVKFKKLKHKQGKDAIFHLSKVPLRSKTSIETTPGRGLWNNKFHCESSQCTRSLLRVTVRKIK